MTVPGHAELTTRPGAPPTLWPAMADRRRPGRPQVSVVVPTYNEAPNLPVLLDRLDLALAHLDYEVIIVDDDSPDLTWQVAESAAGRSQRIRVLRRIGRRGLSSAVMEGMALARGDVLAVLDADLQHDESILPAMVDSVAVDGVDVCVGSRAAPGGSYGHFGPVRRAVSGAGAGLACGLLGVAVSDPMSGFFALSRQRYEEIRTSMTGRGFKILLEVLVRGNRPVVAEVGYCFGQRTAGTTKLTWSVLASYLASVVELALARIQTSAIVTYSLLALVGAALRASLWSLSDAMSRSLTAGAVSIEVAVVVEYWLHNRCTFSRRPHRGWRNVGPLLRFHLVSAYGLAAGGGVATIIDRMVATAPPSQLSARVLTACFSLSSGAVLAVVVASYLLNTRVTWPGGNLGTTYRSQTSRPMTASTSCSISATARR